MRCHLTTALTREFVFYRQKHIASRCVVMMDAPESEMAMDQQLSQDLIPHAMASSGPMEPPESMMASRAERPDDPDVDAPMDDAALTDLFGDEVADGARSPVEEAPPDALVAGEPATLAHSLGVAPPGKLPFMECCKRAQDSGLVMEPADNTVNHIHQSDQQVADFLDLPLTRDLPKGPVSHVFHVIGAPPDDIVDVLRIKLALISGDREQLPAALRPPEHSSAAYSMDVHIVSLASGQKLVLKHFRFENAVRASWAKAALQEVGGNSEDYVLFGLRGQTPPRTWTKALQYMLERLPGEHLCHMKLMTTQEKKAKGVAKKQAENEDRKLPPSARPNATPNEAVFEESLSNMAIHELAILAFLQL